jgi:hypothetical protein
VREFTTAKQRTEEPAGHIAFKLDGKELMAQKPKPAVFAYLTAASARGTSEADKIKAVLDFIEAVLLNNDGSPERAGKTSRAHFRDRLLDPDDSLEIEDAVDLLQYLGEQWSGRPTSSPSDSSPGRRTSGRSSTAGARGKGSTR